MQLQKENEKREAGKDQKENETKEKDEKEKEKETELNETGFYELVGLVTHKGLSANSGHYIGYAKDAKRGWIKYDDEVVTEVSPDEVKKLYGGGQWQMGYECFYRKI